MKNFVYRNWPLAFAAVPGAIAGYLYYHYVGCVSGSCPITSQPVPSTLYGALMGGLLFSMFRDRLRQVSRAKDRRRRKPLA